MVARLAGGLQKEFPGMAGFLPQNIWFRRSFYLAWSARVPKLSQAVRESSPSAPPAPISELPWGHNRLLLSRLDTHTSVFSVAAVNPFVLYAFFCGKFRFPFLTSNFRPPTSDL